MTHEIKYLKLIRVKYTLRASYFYHLGACVDTQTLLNQINNLAI